MPLQTWTTRSDGGNSKLRVPLPSESMWIMPLIQHSSDSPLLGMIVFMSKPPWPRSPPHVLGYSSSPYIHYILPLSHFSSIQSPSTIGMETTARQMCLELQMWVSLAQGLCHIGPRLIFILVAQKSADLIHLHSHTHTHTYFFHIFYASNDKIWL